MERTHSKKKALVVTLAFMLLAAACVAGALAYLQASTSTVKNTFSAAELVSQTSDFTLTEHTAQVSSDGYNWELTTTTASSEQTYSGVLPGASVAKDPQVSLTLVSGVKAYLYVIVYDTTSSDLTYSISSDWTEISGATLPTGKSGTLYYYTGSSATSGVLTGDGSTTVTSYIISENKLTYSSSVTSVSSEDSSLGSLVFTAYAVQAAGFNDAASAWAATYGATS